MDQHSIHLNIFMYCTHFVGYIFFNPQDYQNNKFSYGMYLFYIRIMVIIVRLPRLKISGVRDRWRRRERKLDLNFVCILSMSSLLPRRKRCLGETLTSRHTSNYQLLWLMGDAIRNLSVQFNVKIYAYSLQRNLLQGSFKFEKENL